MTTDSFFSLFCGGMIALLFGLFLCFAGYRFFLVILPIWGFFFGFGLGAQAIQAFTNGNLLGDITSWVVGFIVGVVFAVLSYLFWLFAVAIVCGSLGYVLAAGIWTWLFNGFGFVAWLVAIVVGLAFAFVAIRFDVQKLFVELATGILGAGVIFGTFLLMFNPWAKVVANPVGLALQTSPLLFIVFVVVAAAGVFFQARANASVNISSYNRWEETANSVKA